MSGICGIVQSRGEEKISPDCLVPMIRALGTDGRGEGSWICYPQVGFGHQQHRGFQYGTVELNVGGANLILSFYGNIYNWQEFDSGRPPNGGPLLSILETYEQSGLEFLSRLRGEFALAIWDGRHQSLHLATDRFRVHPIFYYCDHQGLFVFGSRIKSILACPFPVMYNIDPHAILDLVARSYIPTPRSIFHEIQKIPPGHVLTFSEGKVVLNSYWDINFLDTESANERVLAGKLREVFQDALAVRYVEDKGQGNVGTFLSGGVDSSTVTGVLNQLSTSPIKSFSIKFDEQRYNEVQYARIAAQSFGAEHYEYTVTAQDCINCLPILLDSFDEPFANASSIPTYFCSKLALEHDVPFLYAGDGGDELFAGNERYALQRRFDYYSRFPQPFRDYLLKPLVDCLAASVGWSIFTKGKKYIQRASVPYPQRLASYGFFEAVPKDQIFQKDFLEDIRKSHEHSDSLHEYYFRAPAKTELDRQLYIDLKRAIGDNDLFKVTRMSEAAGVAVRFPFLDTCVADFASKVPAHIKMRGTQLRSFFKNAYAGLLPMSIRKKTKHGFGLPIAIWLKTNKTLNEMMNDLLLSQLSHQRGFFNKKTLERVIELHKTDETGFYGSLLWNFMIIELWFRTQLKS